MVGPYFLIVLVHLITVPNTVSYSILNRIPNKLDDGHMLFNRTSGYSSSNLDDCIPIQAVKELKCLLIEKDYLYYGLFESVCEQHQLCYACGSVHGVSKHKCDTLSRIHMHDLCSKNPPSTKFDCLKKHLPTLTLFRQGIYRLSKFSFECFDKCLLNYFNSNPNLE